MRRLLITPYLFIVVLFTSFVYIASCTHDDELLSTSNAAAIVRGTDAFKMNSDGWAFDKAHSNVMWETAYMGSGAMLTGRFNQFGFRSFSFDEANPANTAFEAYVRLNSVNTGEPGRDGGCLLTTLASGSVPKLTTTMTDEPENLAIIKSTKVELSTTDKSYIVTLNMTFRGVTKEVKGKLSYAGKSKITSNTGAQQDLAGLSLEFQIFAKSDFGLIDNNIADKVGIRCNVEFKKS